MVGSGVVALVGAVGSGGGGGGVVGVACFGVVEVVGDNAGSHRVREVWEVDVPLVSLPAYSPELNSVERVFCEVRRYVVGCGVWVVGSEDGGGGGCVAWVV